VVDKPAGITSRDAVNQIQRLVRPSKVGHAGTLDPLATGVLVICLGTATRLISYVQRMRKTYRATFQLGVTSETDDVESPLTPVQGANVPSKDQVEGALENFRGEILQTPPRYSALKLQGRRAYELARKNVDFQLQPRPVTIHAMELIDYRFPVVELRVTCGSGTYIRSIGRDLGELLGVGGVMSALCREAVGTFRLEQALSLDKVGPESLADSLLPLSNALVELPSIGVSFSAAARLRQGRMISVQEVGHVQSASGMNWTADSTNSEIAAFDPQGELVAIVRRVGLDDLKPEKCFPARFPGRDPAC
jgi:tRNA pseudouridine55 synthase